MLEDKVNERIKNFTSLEQQVIVSITTNVITNLKHPFLEMIDDAEKRFELLQAVSDLFSLTLKESKDDFNRNLGKH